MSTDIKIFCDICNQQIEPEKEFLFEASIIETRKLVTDPTIPPKMEKKVIHVCKKCYDSKLKEQIYGKK